MQSNWTSFVSAVGIPVLGLSGLFFSLWHTSAPVASTAAGQELTFLQQPSHRLDKSMAICLREQARKIALCRARPSREGIIQSVSDYNLVARECTPAVSAATHLPPSVEP